MKRYVLGILVCLGIPLLYFLFNSLYFDGGAEVLTAKKNKLQSVPLDESKKEGESSRDNRNDVKEKNSELEDINRGFGQGDLNSQESSQRVLSRVEEKDFESFPKAQEKRETSNQKGRNNKMKEENAIILSELPEGAYYIQDNSLTDEWGVVLQHEKLPEELKNAKNYTITIGNKTYDLTENRFDSTIYNGDVSNLQHTKEDVKAGVVRKK